MHGSWWRWAKPVGGTVVLAVLVARLGGGPFMAGLRATDARSLAAGTAIAAVTTTCAAWRWRLVARRLRVELPLPAAIAACYRAQFLNVTLPGGVLGDLDRGVRHGRQVADLGRGLRVVAWERTAGQVVLVLLTLVALAVAAPPGLPGLAATAWVIAAGLLVLAAARASRKPRLDGIARVDRIAHSGRLRRVVRAAGTDVRTLLEPATAIGIVAASLVVVAGHVATFVLAAAQLGVRLPLTELLPLALLVLLVSGVPLNVAGWGPREGSAAWAFAAAGLGATQGLAVAVAYGTIVFVAALPGAVLLAAGRSRWSGAGRSSRAGEPDDAGVRSGPAYVAGGRAHG